MKALALTEDQTLQLVDRPDPIASGPRDVVVKVTQTGICGTDRSVLVGKFRAAPGTIMGHEAIGVVAETGPAVTGLRVGDRVVVNPTLYCGRCDYCLRGKRNHCLNKAGTEVGIDRDGSYAEYIVLEDLFLHLIPSDTSDDRAVLIEPLACVLNNIDAARMTPASTVTVLGGGPIGLLCVLVLAHFGHPVTLVEQDTYRRSFATTFLDGVPENSVRIVGADELGQLPGTDVVIDTVGGLLDKALAHVSAGGLVVIMGFDSRAAVTVRPLEILQRGISIVGAMTSSRKCFPEPSIWHAVCLWSG